jgi:hypothetical protein
MNWRSNILAHHQCHQRRIPRYRKYSQRLCSGTCSNSNGRRIILKRRPMNTQTPTSLRTINLHSRQSTRVCASLDSGYIIKEIFDTIDRINEAKPGCTIHIEWVPGHKIVEANERADRAPKAAAASCATPPTTIMKSAQNRSIQSMTKTKWETEWKTGGENARRLRNMSQHPDTTAGPTLCKILSNASHQRRDILGKTNLHFLRGHDMPTIVGSRANYSG